MSSIVLLDTTIFLNILNVPDHNQDRKKVLDDWEIKIKRGDKFRLPMATIWETGNHIANIRNGSVRFTQANNFVTRVIEAIKGDAPYKTTFIPNAELFSKWLEDFPESVKTSSSKRAGEGMSLANFSIIQEWKMVSQQCHMTRVLIWSLATDMLSYDTRPESR